MAEIMKFLLIPGNNSLSHVAKCLALEAELTARGHRPLIAVSAKHGRFLDRLHKAYVILPDIQEADGSASPTWEWFRCADRIQRCIRAEIDLIRRFRPDRVLGVFRFTPKAAAAALGVPYDTLVCGCMMPDNREVLGFAPGEPGAECQAFYLDNFFRFAGRKIGRAMEGFGLAPITDARLMLEGERTFLWDFPEFMPLPPKSYRFHVGPLKWEQWPDAHISTDACPKGHRRLAVLTFGTCCVDRSVAEKLLACLLDSDYDVVIAAGGQPDLAQIRPDNGRGSVCAFAPLKELLQKADLVVAHGGQMTLFESLAQGVPVLVMPFQPEQAHNGVCLERIGCGRRIVPGVAYRGDSQVYVQALIKHSNLEICDTIHAFTNSPLTAIRLSAARRALDGYGGASRLADMLVQD